MVGPFRKQKQTALGLAISWLFVSAVQAGSVHCPPQMGEGAAMIRDLDGDNVKDFRYDAATGNFKRTETDSAGNKKELWCLDHGGGSQFVWMYIPAQGEPGAGTKKFIGFCEFDGGGNIRTETKDPKTGKFSSTKHVNTDRFNRHPTLKKRIYEFNPKTCKITQTTVKDDETTTKKENVDVPTENGRRIGLPLANPHSFIANLILEEEHQEIPPEEEVNQSDTPVCDIDEDRDVDIDDINTIFKARNTVATVDDPRDADGDGVITVNDARICTLQCAKPKCAP